MEFSSDQSARAAKDLHPIAINMSSALSQAFPLIPIHKDALIS